MGAAYDALAKALRIYTVDPSAVSGGSTSGGTATATASSAPASKPVAITKSDSTDLSSSGIRGIYVGGAGDVVVIGLNDTTNAGAGTAVTFVGVPVGTILPVVPKRVMAATTATNLVGLA